MHSLLRLSAGATAAALLIAAVPAAADDCAALNAAATAQATLPYASTTVTTTPGKPDRHSEMIVVDDMLYQKDEGGSWQALPYDSQKVIDAIGDAAAGTHHCRKTGSEPVDGEPAAIIIDRPGDAGKTGEARYWISDSRGLPLKLELQGEGGKMIREHWRYDSIQAPSGAKPANPAP
jgi:hypothetical protein